MSWFNLWDGLKTKTCRYLLQRYLGQFFENNLNLEQLKVDLYNGKAVVENISLKVNAINDLFESQGWAFEVVSGHIGCLTAMVPWNALMINDSSLNITDLTITLRPVTRFQNGTTMLESMWSSVSSSMQMAEECMKQIDDDMPFMNHNNTMIGLEKFAETIDNVLNRIHANLFNTTLIIEYALPRSTKKMIVSFKAKHVEYKNQTGYGQFSTPNETPENETDQPPNLRSLPMIANHNLVTKDLTIYTTEVVHNENYANLESTGRLCKIVELKGCQNFKISIKQTENIVGPKVNLEVLIDDIYFMLTPRQTHMLLNISKGFNNVRPKDSMLKKYSDLKTKISDVPTRTKMTGNVENDGIWCSDSFRKPESYNEKSYTRKCESVLSSTSTNSLITSCTNTKTNIGCAETSGEILKFKMQMFKIIGIILHNDILLETTNNVESKSIFSNESYVNYSQIAGNFFPSANKEQCMEECYLPLINANYLLFTVSSLLFNGNQQRFCQELSLKTTLSATMADFCEILDNVKYHLILFDRKKNCQEGYHTRPEVILSHTSTYFFKDNNRSINQIECTLDDCTTDIDISIYDRLSALFRVSTLKEENNIAEIASELSNPMNIEVKCNSLKLHLRFPIVDGRSPLDPKKIPCWKKNIRSDYLSFDLKNLSIKCKSYVSIYVDEVDGFYCDDGNDNVIHFMKCSNQNKLRNLTTHKQKICLKVQYLNELSKDGHITVCESCPKGIFKSPFSSKCSYGYSSNFDGNNADRTEFFLPGDTEEINGFCESCTKLSDIQIVASVPKIEIVLESKELYEKLYNRLNGDLLMWEPQSLFNESKNRQQYNSKNYEADCLRCIDADNFDISGSVSPERNIFSVESKTQGISPLIIGSNNCSFQLCVEEGIIIMYTEGRESESNDQPSHYGKLQLNLKEFKLFSVSSFNNDKNLSYFCIQLKDIDARHCGQIFYKLPWSDVDDINLIRIIRSLPKDQTSLSNRDEVISIVAELKKQPDKRLKRIKLAFGINSAILFHNPSYAVHNWIYQLTDFLNITDFPIEAYEPYSLVSEIQCHIWNLTIEYRPKYLSYQALIDIGYCSLSSNIIYPLTGCTLRLMMEDCILSIGPIVNCSDDFNESNVHVCCNTLVPVLNVGLVNFSIRLYDQSKTYRNIDLRSSIHEVHLKTCFDSAEALAQLIAYVANDKDLISIDENTTKHNKTDGTHLQNSDYNHDDQINNINKLMADALKDVDAIQYSTTQITNKFDENCKEDSQRNILYDSRFDNCKKLNVESNVMLKSFYDDEKSEYSQVQSELGATSPAKAPELEDKDFHVIHGEEIFFMDKFGVEQIYVSEDPLRIVDNHFCLPNEKLDLLSPPVHFPVPEQSYTMCEMTFTWHLYGGKDFSHLPLNLKKKTSLSTGIEMSDTYKHGVSQDPVENTRNLKKNITEDPNISQRKSDVLVEIQFSKIRCAYDMYPVHSIYSSRLALVVLEIEIRDRLLSSDINKLLYHPNKSNIPQRNDENMITVKALNVRTNLKKNWTEECSLKVSILPIRLNIDQDTLMFLEEFFSSLIKRSTDVDTANEFNLESNLLDRDAPVMAVNEISSALHDLINQSTSDQVGNGMFNSDSKKNTFPKKVYPIYFKEFVFSPALPICFDYHGRRIELSRGPITGLVMGLAQLQGSGICLREVINRRGLLGWNKLFEFVCKEWLKDIKRNQLPNILSGIGPTNAVLQLFHGFFDLFRLPLQQYNKDGRIMRGFQLGAQSFSARTAFAALEITSRIIHLLQFTAETTFEILSSGPSSTRRRKTKQTKNRQGRPKDLREGVANAYTIVKEGINESANTLMEAAIVEHDQKGYTGAVGAVVRQLPQLLVSPAVLATQATTNILGGAKSSLVPEAKREATDKWKNSKN